MVGTWHGTNDEGRALVDAINANCTCEYGLMGVRLSTCVSHQMLLTDQRALDGVLAYRHMRDRLLAEENRVTPAP